MRIGIVEDNVRDCETLAALVSRWAAEREVEVQIGSYADAASFLEARARGPFDAVLLDCYLDGRTSHGADAPGFYGVGTSPATASAGPSACPAATGMDVARVLRRGNDDCPLVFITSSRDFAVEGYEVGAAGYVLKPVSYAQLKTALNRALPPERPSEPTISLPTREGAILLHPGEIMWCRSQGHYLDVHAKGGTLRVRMTTTELSGRLESDARFYGCARGWLVNLDCVQGIDGLDYLMANGDKVPISRANLSEARNRYANRVFARMRG